MDSKWKMDPLFSAIETLILRKSNMDPKKIQIMAHPPHLTTLSARDPDERFRSPIALLNEVPCLENGPIIFDSRNPNTVLGK